MIKLRKILLSNYLYLILIILGSFFEIYHLEKDTKSKYPSTTKEVTVYLTDYKIDGNQLSLECKGKEKLIGNYYFKTKQEKNKFIKNIQLGDKLKITGKLKRPNQNTTEHLFNYRKYLERKSIFYIIQIENIYLLEENHHLFYWIKDGIYKKTENPYLRTFILGDTSLISKNIIKNYQEIGISHLFAISGMHISLLSGILLKILKKAKVKENTRYLIVSLFLMCYLCLVGFSPSVLRAVLFFILFSINKIYYFYIKPVHIFIIVLLISLIIQPNSIFDVAFLYSFSISFALIVLSSFINRYKNYFFKLLLTSIISFIVSLPITLYHFNQINVLSIVYNLLYVPLISIVIFPLSFITFFISPLEHILNIGIHLLEYSSSLFSKIHLSKLIFCNIPYFFYFLYCFFIVLFFIGLRRKKYFYLSFLLVLLICHYMYPYINQEDYLTMLDVGQGDSILLHSQNKTVLVDTGGMMSYNNEKWSKRKNNYSIVENITIPYLKKQGIKKIDDLILTHGDDDHMGEAINLVENLKVKEVILNCGEFNDLEKDLIKVLEQKNIKYYSCVKELNIDNNKLYFLQTYLYDNENDNSNVIYTEINGYKFLFMGDAGVTTEKEIMNNYNLLDIDVLKVGHHGSKTSSSNEFINEINPKYSIISVGKNNRYGHPNKEVLNSLENSKIYRTDEDGSIMFKIKNNKLKIETCSP